jgi:hypothetical protein
VSTASIIALMREAVRTSETSFYFNNATLPISQNAAIFRLAAVRI